MRFGLFANHESKKAINVARRVLKHFKDGIPVEEKTAEALGVKGIPLEQMDIDILVTVGGDGTILRALQRTRTKILGIDVGVIGFLTELKIDDIESGLERAAEGKFAVESRGKLKVVLNDWRLHDCTNEVVIHTANVAKMRRFGAFISDQQTLDVRADGMIVATSTGSTSYSMSVGGPIIDPRVNAMVIAPIAPFKLSARPIVVPFESRISVKILEPEPCVVVLDGQEEVEIRGHEKLEVSASEHKAEFIRFSENFYKRIQEKLGG